MKIYDPNLEKARNSDWGPTRSILTSDVEQTRWERGLEEKEKEYFMFKAGVNMNRREI